MQDEHVEQVITDGFVDNDAPGRVFFAKAERQPGGDYQFKVGYRSVNACQYTGGIPGLSLAQAFDHMDRWERKKHQTNPNRMNSGEFEVAGPNFRAVAREMGIPVGPEEKSLHHAARAKRAAASRRRKGVGP